MHVQIRAHTRRTYITHTRMHVVQKEQALLELLEAKDAQFRLETEKRQAMEQQLEMDRQRAVSTCLARCCPLRRPTPCVTLF
jgi:hypothetical protein